MERSDRLCHFPKATGQAYLGSFPLCSEKKKIKCGFLGLPGNVWLQRSSSSLPVGGLRVPGCQRQAGQGHERTIVLASVHLSAPKRNLLLLDGSPWRLEGPRAGASTLSQHKVLTQTGSW